MFFVGLQFFAATNDTTVAAFFIKGNCWQKKFPMKVKSYSAS